MHEENIAAVVEEILKSRDVLSSITDGDVTPPSVPGETSSKLITREDIKNACDIVKLDAAKVAVLFSNGSKVPVQGTRDIINAFNHHIVSLSYTASLCLPGGGKHLHKQVNAALRALGAAAAKLLTGVACVLSRQGQPPQLAVLAEQVRTKADAVAKVPLDQRAAVCKAVAAAGISVKDVLRELNSLLEDSRACQAETSAQAASLAMQDLSLTSTAPPASITFTTSNDSTTTSSAALDPVASQDTTHHVSGPLEHADAAAGSAPAALDASTTGSSRGHEQHDAGGREWEEGGDSDSLLELQPQDLLPQEAQRVVAATAALHCTFTAIKGCMALAMNLPTGVGRAEEVEHWDALAMYTSKLQEAADDLGCAMIPPQSEQEVTESCRGLRQQAEEVGKHVEGRLECFEIAAVCKAMKKAVELVAVCSSQQSSAPQL